MGFSSFLWFKHTVCGIFTLLLFGGVGVGFYTIGLSIEDEKSTQVSEIDGTVEVWNSDSYVLFNGTSVRIQTDSLPITALNATVPDDWTVHSDDLVSYESLVYTGEILLFDDSYQFTQEELDSSDTYEYKLVGHLELLLEQNNLTKSHGIDITYLKKIKHYSHLCQNGYWDIRTNQCYYHYAVREYCIAVNETDLTVSNHPCIQDERTMYEIIKWNSWNIPVHFTTPVYLQVRSINDPYLYTLNNGIDRLSLSRWQYWWLSVVTIIYCLLFLMIPAFHFYRTFKRPKLAEQEEKVEFSRI